MDRTVLERALVIPAALLLAAACGSRADAGSVDERPGVLLVTIDTLRADHLGAWGYGRDTSPGLDALAERGVVFERAFATMPTTVPSHASMLMGTWPRVHGSRTNFHRISNTSLPYLPALLAEAGYDTAAFLSMGPLARHLEGFGGFDRIDAPEGEKIYSSSEEVLPVAAKWIEARDDGRPFFAWVHLWDPHSPYRLHPELMARLRPGFDTVDLDQPKGFHAEGAYDERQAAAMVDLYDNEIAHVDRELSAFLERLEAGGRLDDAWIVVTSDHGETLDELLPSHGYAFDHGEFLFDHQLHVPLIVLPPGGREGCRVSEPVSLVDLMPTLLDAVGLPIPRGTDGRSLVGLLDCGDDPGHEPYVFVQRRFTGKPQREFLAGEQFGVRGEGLKLLRSVQLDRWALLANGREVEGPVEEQDDEEAELRRRLEAWLDRTAEHADQEVIEVDEGVRQELNDLGYVDGVEDE